jgi:hypothetical protein
MSMIRCHGRQGTFMGGVLRLPRQGAIRDDVMPIDLLRATIGFSYDKAHPDWKASARRLVDIFMDGLRCKT